MERLEVKDMHELAINVSGWLISLDSSDEYPSIGVVGFYDDIRQLMRELVILGYDIKAAELEYRELDNYDKEFLLYLTENGISVEKAWNDEFGRYFFIEADIVAVIDNCNSSVLKSINADVSLEIGVGDNIEDDKDVHTKARIIDRDDGGIAEETVEEDSKKQENKAKAEVTEETAKKNKDFKVMEDDDGELHGFSLSHTFGNGGYASYSYYSTDTLTLDDVDKIARLMI